MLNCLEHTCIGWAVLPEDHFCSWCGSRMAELSLEFEQQSGDDWKSISPPVLTRDRRPAMQVQIRHSGHSGAVALSPDDAHSSSGWLGLNTSVLAGCILNPGESVAVPVNRLKVPGKEDSVQEVTVEVRTSSLSAQETLQFVPPPKFQLDLASSEILLLPGEPAVIDASLRLTQGRIVMTEVPKFQGRWVELELNPEIEFPLELDARGRSSLALHLKVKENTVHQLRESAMGQREESLRRGGMLRLSGLIPWDEPINIPVEVAFLLGPELHVDPFGDQQRLDWERLRGLEDGKPMQLVLGNGAPDTPGRVDLTIRYLDLAYLDDGPQGWLEFDQSRFPLTIQSGKSAVLELRADPVHMGSNERTARLTFVSNDPMARSYYLRVENAEPTEFQGWLVVDLGTSNTCAVLVDENQARTVMLLEEQSLDGQPTTLPSVVCYLELVSNRKFEVGTWAWERSAHPAAARSVVVAAKRRLGDRDFRFEVVPVDEPQETCYLTPREVLADLLGHVVDKALEHLAARGRHDLLLRRTLICHPSRFSVHQIDELKRAARTAMEQRLRSSFPDAPAPEEPHTLHEPIGAALHFLNDWCSHAPVHERRGEDITDYTLLVYDFGGGTLDITLLKVESRRKSRKPRAQASPEKQLKARLRSLIASRCRTLVNEETGGAFSIPSEQAESNSYLLDQFISSVMTAMPTRWPLKPDKAWQEVCANPSVNDKLLLTFQADGTASERVFSRDEIIPTSQEFRSELLPLLPAEQQPEFDDQEHPYSYSVQPEVLGATGHRWLGGEDVTAIVRDLLVQRLTEAVEEMEDGEVRLPIGAEGLPAHLAMTGRRNESLLRNWAEALKLKLSDGAPEEELRSTYQSLHFLVDGEELLYSGTVLWKGSTPPTLEEVHQRIRPRLEETVGTIGRLLARHHLEAPDVILRVGKASRLPIVDEILREAFPDSDYLAPADSKECVVKGAATHPITGRVSGGLQLSRGVGKPTVRVQLTQQQALNATTSRLGIKVVDAGEAWFHELIGAGLAVPEEGLTAGLDGIVFYPGKNPLPILENAGHRNRLVLEDGRQNPDIMIVRTFDVEIPEGVEPELLEEAELSFHLSKELDLSLEVRVGELEPLRFETIPSTDFGTSY